MITKAAFYGQAAEPAPAADYYPQPGQARLYRITGAGDFHLPDPRRGDLTAGGPVFYILGDIVAGVITVKAPDGQALTPTIGPGEAGIVVLIDKESYPGEWELLVIDNFYDEPSGTTTTTTTTTTSTTTSSTTTSSTTTSSTTTTTTTTTTSTTTAAYGSATEITAQTMA